VSVGVVDCGAVSKVANRLTGILGAAEEDGVASLGSAQGELIESDAFTTGLGNTVSIFKKNWSENYTI
jgi:hypothetical protein